MEYYQVFLKVILKEIQRFQLNTEVYSTFVNQLTASLDGNFDVPYNRCAYMYKYASITTYFFKDSVNQFLLDYSDAKDLLLKWKTYPEVNVCSLSIGPGLDYLAFVLAILENDPLQQNFTGATVISKHGAWRNTTNFLLEVFREHGSIFEVTPSKLKYENMKVIQADLFKCFLENSTPVSLNNAHVVLMMKTLNVLAAGTPQEGPILNMLKGLISSLKSDAVIFCIDTKPSLALFSQALSNFPGKFLYGPIYRSIKFPFDFPEVNGCRPAVQNRGAFFVWQKLPSFPSMTNLSTSLDTIPVGTDYDSNLSSLSASCSLKDEANEDKDLDNVPWAELKTLWRSSTPEIKKVLKKLMLSDAKSLEQIGDTNFQSVNDDIEKNLPSNFNRTELLKGAEGSPTTNNLSSTTIYDQSYPLNQSCDGSSFYTVNDHSPTETLNSVNSLIYENNASFSEFDETNPIANIKEITSREETIFKDVSRISRGEDKVKTINALDGNPTSSTSVKILTEQINHLVNDAPTKYNSIATKINSEDCIIAKNAASHEKVIQTDSHESSNSTSIKDLTDYIRNLVTSLESTIQQNEPPKCHSQNPFAPDCDIHDVPTCSKYSPNFGSTEKKNLDLSKCTAKKNTLQCRHSHCSCYQMQFNYQPSCSYVPTCCSQFVPRCSLSCCRQPPRSNLEEVASPSIVIPLQNISEETLLKIVSILESRSKSK